MNPWRLRTSMLPVLGALGFCACNGVTEQQAHLADLEPNSVLLGTSPPMTLLGEHFYKGVSVDLDSSGPVKMDDAFAVYLGAAHLRALDVKRWSNERITFTLPTGLSVGAHELKLVLPGNRQAELPNALQVLAPIVVSGSGGAGSGGTSSGGTSSGGVPGATGGSSGSGGVGTVGFPAPLAKTFGDDFEDGIIGPEWQTSLTLGCSIVESEGALRFELDGRAAGCETVTRDAFDLRGDQARFTIPPITDYSPPLFFFIELIFPNGEKLRVGFANNRFVVRWPPSRQLATPSSVAYLPASDYWRLIEQGGVLFFESSPDAQTWRMDFDLGVGWSLESVRIGVGAEASAVMPGAVNISTLAYNRP